MCMYSVCLKILLGLRMCMMPRTAPSAMHGYSAWRRCQALLTFSGSPKNSTKQQ